jgi:hypothetical protein
MPNGLKLEAHSGFGQLIDDPNHVSERNVGATPPAVYDLKPRERLFHGIEALRMIPVEGNATLGRSGFRGESSGGVRAIGKRGENIQLDRCLQRFCLLKRDHGIENALRRWLGSACGCRHRFWLLSLTGMFQF